MGLNSTGSTNLLDEELEECNVEPLVCGRRLHHFFEGACDEHPSNVAVVCGLERLTYAELDVQANRLAQHLIRRGVGPGKRVGLLMERSVNTYVSLLAVLKTGAAFVPLDPSFPPQRIGLIAEDAELALLATTSEFGAVIDAVGCAVLVLDTAAAAIAAEPKGRPVPDENADSLCYIIYTSGTTGQPKGVAVNHSHICNFLDACSTIYGVTAADRVYQGMTLAFDFSVEEIWPTFRAGATIIAGPGDHRRFGPGLTEFLIEQRITVLACVPTLLATIERDVPTLRTLLVGGEACPADLVKRWARPGRRMLNTYGPTETSVTATWTELSPGKPVTIGRPLPTYEAFILDADLQLLPQGQAGEICIGGPSVAVGYVNRPELTADRFIPDPFSDRPGARLYRTGDLGMVNLAGEIEYLGRIDTQVKIRGYRIELAEIEAVLLEDISIANAIVAVVRGAGGVEELAAFVVPRPGADFAEIRRQLHATLRQRLPAYMVPAYIEPIDAVPMLPSQKADRSRLPKPLGPRLGAGGNGAAAPLETALEHQIAGIWAKVFGHEIHSAEANFFLDCGGDSLFAAGVVSELRRLPELTGLGMADLYGHPTIRGLAKLAVALAPAARPINKPAAPRPRKSLVPATLIQTAWLASGLIVSGAILYVLAFQFAPGLTRSLGLSSLLLATPLLYVAGMSCYLVGTVVFAVVLKKLLIGRYRPRRDPLWGSFFVRNWIVHQTVRLIPWQLLEGTVFQCAVLRALGARIGKRVHIHRGVNLLDGGWDLLELGDDVTLSRDVTVRLIDLDERQIVVGSITIGSGCTLHVRSGVAPETRMEPDSCLAAHAYLASGHHVPRGVTWSGAPAVPAGDAPLPPRIPQGAKEVSATWHGIVLCSARLLFGAVGIVPVALLAMVATWGWGIDGASAAQWFLHPSLGLGQCVLSVILVVLSVPLLLVWRCLSLRCLGRIPPGVISRWSYAYIRVQLKTDIVDWANDWLCGTLLWPIWLRGAGMKIGPWTEMTSIYDTIPELVEIGTKSFLADAIYLGSPRIHRGTVTLERVKLGDQVFVGNFAVIPGGQRIPDGVLIGVCTIADDAIMKTNTAWFGQPPFQLPRREIVTADASLTFRPSWLRLANRVCWDCLRFALPLAPVLLILAWSALLGIAEKVVSLPVLVLGVIPALDLMFLASVCLLGVALKWLLLGRVRPGTHPLWSSWSSRWEFNYMAWYYLALDPMSMLEGTIWLNWYLRLLGVKIGRNVVLYDVFAFCIDPDMLQIGDDATVSCLYQAHTFEDRVHKIGRIVIGNRATVGSGAMVLYATHIGDDAHVVAHSVVMKGESLEPGQTYAGCPTRLVSGNFSAPSSR